MTNLSNQSEDIKFPLMYQEISELLPHRYPLLLIDRVLGIEDGNRIVGLKNITANEEFFQGHFPGRPIMPGVLMLEALAQLGVIFAKVCVDSVDRDQLYVFAGADEVRFRRPVVPGDVLKLEMTLLARKKAIWKMRGVASVDNEVAIEGILTAAVLPQNRK